MKQAWAKVEVTACGEHLERFLTICAYRGIRFQQIQWVNDRKIVFGINTADYIRCHSAIRKTGTRTAIRTRYGLSFLLSRFKKKWLFISGFLVLIVFLYFQFNRVWRITVTGCDRVTEEQVLKILSENNIESGVKRNSIRTEAVEKLIRDENERISWVSCTLRGTELHVAINERLMLHEKVLQGGNLIAPCDGEIVKMVTRKGVPQVIQGQCVKKGDLLVAGVWEQYNPDMTISSVTSIPADADIYLKHSEVISFSLPMNYVGKEYTGREVTCNYLQIYDAAFQTPKTLFKGLRDKGPNAFEYYDIYRATKQCKLFGKYYLPMWTIEETYAEYEPQNKQYNMQEAQQILFAKYHDFLSILEEKGIQFIEKDVNIELNGYVYNCTVSLELTENIYERIDT